jgi:hypothetical protein
MWNSNMSSEFVSGVDSVQPLGGVAPLRYDRSHHVYLEKKQAHAEMDRCTIAQFRYTAIFHWAHDLTKLHCQAARNRFNAHMARLGFASK